jgi:hypothetical protein
MDWNGVFLESVIMNILIKHLSVIEYWNLRQAVPGLFKKMYVPTVNDLVHQRLIVALDKFQGVKGTGERFMKSFNHRYFITGGFLLGVIQGDSLVHETPQCYERDHDLPVDANKNKYIDIDLVRVGSLTFREDNVKEYQKIHLDSLFKGTKTDNLPEFEDYKSDEIKTVLRTKHTIDDVDTKIDYLCVFNTNSALRFVREFDLDVVRNIYSFQHGLMMFSPLSITKRECSLDLEMGSRMRIKLMDMRSELNGAYIDNLRHKTIPVIYNRLHKYHKRGYKLHIVNYKKIMQVDKKTFEDIAKMGSTADILKECILLMEKFTNFVWETFWTKEKIDVLSK